MNILHDKWQQIKSNDLLSILNPIASAPLLNTTLPTPQDTLEVSTSLTIVYILWWAYTIKCKAFLVQDLIRMYWSPSCCCNMFSHFFLLSLHMLARMLLQHSWVEMQIMWWEIYFVCSNWALKSKLGDFPPIFQVIYNILKFPSSAKSFKINLLKLLDPKIKNVYIYFNMKINSYLVDREINSIFFYLTLIFKHFIEINDLLIEFKFILGL